MIPNNALKDIYSEREIRIGTWIDGKPLYRKTFIFKKTTTGTNNLDLAFSTNLKNLKLVWYDEGNSFAKLSNGYVIQLGYYENSDDYMRWDINLSTGNIRIKGGANLDGVTIDFYITLKYTKTTD